MQQDIFDQLAPGWYNCRHRSIFSTELKTLAERWRGGRLLNLGCAHGPDFIPFRHNFELYGVDFSSEMLRLAGKYSQKYGFDVSLSLADIRRLPYADATFDWAIAVASYHHIQGETERQKALHELQRVLKPGGEAFITVWNRWQPGFWFKTREVSIPWRQKDRTLYRYYYLFSYAELERVVKEVGLQVIRSFPENTYRFPVKIFSRNICLLARKAY